jgi:hypothetical protein
LNVPFCRRIPAVRYDHAQNKRFRIELPRFVAGFRRYDATTLKNKHFRIECPVLSPDSSGTMQPRSNLGDYAMIVP